MATPLHQARPRFALPSSHGAAASAWQRKCHQVQPVASSLPKQQPHLESLCIIFLTKNLLVYDILSGGAIIIMAIFQDTDDCLFLTVDTGQSNIQLAM